MYGLRVFVDLFRVFKPSRKHSTHQTESFNSVLCIVFELPFRTLLQTSLVNPIPGWPYGGFIDLTTFIHEPSECTDTHVQPGVELQILSHSLSPRPHTLSNVVPNLKKPGNEIQAAPRNPAKPNQKLLQPYKAETPFQHPSSGHIMARMLPTGALPTDGHCPDTHDQEPDAPSTIEHKQ